MSSLENPSSPKSERRAPMSRELPTEHLASTDKDGHRVYLYPAEVKGRFRTARIWVHWILIGILVVGPWIPWNGEQAILLNFVDRHIHLFCLHLWAHNAPILVLVLAALALTMIWLTAIFGRFWCGWLCPQTVFGESVFRWIERAIEGHSLDRKKLDAGPWTFDKLWKKTLKYALFALAAGVITHSFLAYFVGAKHLGIASLSNPQENWTLFVTMLVCSAVLLFDLGWFREQFCVIVCPYGRFQSFIMDDASMAVTYDAKRGEPRGTGAATQGQPHGDCINCYKCVQACPTGIDIRRGVQLECVACTACMDACDDVMERTKKPKGLIRYSNWPPKLSTRSAIYVGLWVASLVGLYAVISSRPPLEVAWVRAKDTPFSIVPAPAGQSGEWVANRYIVDVFNQTGRPQTIQFSAGENVALITPTLPTSLAFGQKAKYSIVVMMPKTAFVLGKAHADLIWEERPATSPVPSSVSQESPRKNLSWSLPMVGPMR